MICIVVMELFRVVNALMTLVNALMTLKMLSTKLHVIKTGVNEYVNLFKRETVKIYSLGNGKAAVI